jgi:ABC-2 type transport system permease protein
MRKILSIGWKDFRLIVRDRTALLLMLAAPFVLTLGLGFVSGRFSGSSNGSALSNIPVVIVNQDTGQLGQALVNVFSSSDVAGLVAPSSGTNPAAARGLVEADQATAAVIIPSGFTASIIPAATTGQPGPAVSIEVYANPARPVGAGVIESIVNTFISRVETARVSGQVSIQQLLAHALITPAQVAGLAAGFSGANGEQAAPLISVQRVDLAGGAVAPAGSVDALAVFAPGMALMFLMYTVSYGGRSLLSERAEGTLPRLLSTPTGSAQVLAGKLFGMLLSGVAQVAVLVAGSSLLFHLSWGSPLAVGMLIVAASAAATGWGLLLAAFARTPAQVASVGSALMLIFGMLSGAFIPLSTFPGWLQSLAHLSPNAWGLDAFTTLARGGTLPAILPGLAVLLGMAVALFAAASLLFRRNNFLSR